MLYSILVLPIDTGHRFMAVEGTIMKIAKVFPLKFAVYGICILYRKQGMFRGGSFIII